MLCFRGVRIFPALEYYKLLYYAWVTFGFSKDFFLAARRLDGERPSPHATFPVKNPLLNREAFHFPTSVEQLPKECIITLLKAFVILYDLDSHINQFWQLSLFVKMPRFLC